MSENRPDGIERLIANCSSAGNTAIYDGRGILIKHTGNSALLRFSLNDLADAQNAHGVYKATIHNGRLFLTPIDEEPPEDNSLPKPQAQDTSHPAADADHT